MLLVHLRRPIPTALASVKHQQKPQRQHHDRQFCVNRSTTNEQISNKMPYKGLVVSALKEMHAEEHRISLTPTAASNLLAAYLQLSKCRLTALIACTAVSGFLMSPALGAAPLSLFGTCVAGTALLSASASTCNNVIERQYDSQMQRTKSRVLPVGRLTPLHALSFAAATGFTGLGLLCLGCNHLTSGLGFLNLALYVGCYTPMKRIHHSCTWVGAVVGAIPPLMGYAAATGCLDAASLVLAAILFSWQFPHFNALSWNLRRDYAMAGYKMMCVTDEGLCRRTTLRHSLLLLPLCSLAAPCTELTTWMFALTSLPLNIGLLYLAWKFYAKPEKYNATRLFRFTLIYLPVLMALLYAFKDERKMVKKEKQISSSRRWKTEA